MTIATATRLPRKPLSHAAMVATLLGLLGCAAAPAVSVTPLERAVSQAATENVHIERQLEVQGFLEALSGGYLLGVRVRNVGPSDRIVLTGESAFREAVFVDAEGEETLRLGTSDDAPLADTSCEPMDGVLLRAGEELRLIRAFEETIPQVAARGEFELHFTPPGGVLPVIVRRVRFETPLTTNGTALSGSSAPLPADASAAGLQVAETEVLVSAEPSYFAGVRLGNHGSAPVVVPLFGLLHAAAEFGEGELFPLVAFGTMSLCSHCGPSHGLRGCDFLEGLLLSPGESITLVADLEVAEPPPAGPARVAYQLDAYPLSCAGAALHMSGEFVAEPQPFR